MCWHLEEILWAKVQSLSSTFFVVVENSELQIWNIILDLCTFYRLLLRQMICRKLQGVFFLIMYRKNKFVWYLSRNISLIQSQIFQCSLEQKLEVIPIHTFPHT